MKGWRSQNDFVMEFRGGIPDYHFSPTYATTYLSLLASLLNLRSKGRPYIEAFGDKEDTWMVFQTLMESMIYIDMKREYYSIFVHIHSCKEIDRKLVKIHAIKFWDMTGSAIEERTGISHWNYQTLAELVNLGEAKTM